MWLFAPSTWLKVLDAALAEVLDAALAEVLDAALAERIRALSTHFTHCSHFAHLYCDVLIVL
jgi:hypothetical protein